MGYLFLLLTIVTESMAVIFMKMSNGFEHKLQAVIALVAYGLSFVFLTLALKYLPVGLANALWAGVSTILIALAGMMFLKEQVSLVQWIFILLIVIGLAGLNFTKST
jgi:small multidrug resistance pump